MWVRVAGRCKKRQREVSHAKEGEWGNIFHFLFPSSHCQGINRYPLKLIPALCKRMGENRRGGAVYCWPSWVRWNGAEYSGKWGKQEPLKNPALSSRSTVWMIKFKKISKKANRVRVTTLSGYITISADFSSVTGAKKCSRISLNSSLWTPFCAWNRTYLTTSSLLVFGGSDCFIPFTLTAHVCFFKKSWLDIASSFFVSNRERTLEVQLSVLVD